MFGAKSSNNAEYDEHDNPTESFKLVDEFISEKSDDKRNESDENDADDKWTFPI
jgi:hypothetical protein